VSPTLDSIHALSPRKSANEYLLRIPVAPVLGLLDSAEVRTRRIKRSWVDPLLSDPMLETPITTGVHMPRKPQKPTIRRKFSLTSLKMLFGVLTAIGAIIGGTERFMHEAPGNPVIHNEVSIVNANTPLANSASVILGHAPQLASAALSPNANAHPPQDATGHPLQSSPHSDTHSNGLAHSGDDQPLQQELIEEVKSYSRDFGSFDLSTQYIQDPVAMAKYNAAIRRLKLIQVLASAVHNTPISSFASEQLASAGQNVEGLPPLH